MISLEIEVRRARVEDAKSLANIIVESWRLAYENILPREEMGKFLDKERRQQQFKRFIKGDKISNKPVEMRYRIKI